MAEGSLEVKLPTIWTDGKAEVARVREEKRREEERRERVRTKKMQVREKVGKSRNTCVVPMICGSGGSKSRLAKAADAEPSGQMRDEKLHAVVARSTCRSQKRKRLRCSGHFWTFGCRFAWQARVAIFANCLLFLGHVCAQHFLLPAELPLHRTREVSS